MGLTGINESSRNAPLQQLQKKQNSLGASFNRSGLITGSATNLTVSGQLKSQAYSNSQIQNMKGIPTVIQGSGIPQLQNQPQNLGVLKAKSRKGRRAAGYSGMNASNTF